MTIDTDVRRCEATKQDGQPVATNCYLANLQKDLERLLRYASSEKTIELSESDFKLALDALRKTKKYCEVGEDLSESVMQDFLKAIETISRKAHPVTAASLEVSELMGMNLSVLDERQAAIKRRVVNLIFRSGFLTISALVVVGVIGTLPLYWTELSQTPYNAYHMNALYVAIGLLGACSYVLRSILTKLGAQTFVPREGWSYLLRFILGATLGYVIPIVLGKVGGQPTSGLDPETGKIVAFLAGYAVEPMFAALDNLVETVKDLVGRSPLGKPGAAK